MKTQIFLFVMLLILLASSQFGSQVLAQTILENSGITQIGRWPNGPCYASFIDGDYAYIGNGSALDILDISDKTAPVRIGRIIMNNVVEKFAISGDYAYICDGESSLLIFDISRPQFPYRVGVYNSTIGEVTDVCVSDRYAYASIAGIPENDESKDGLCIIDISQPSSPRQVGFIDLDESAIDLTISGKYAYVRIIGWDSSQVIIIDISTPSSPTIAGRFEKDPTNDIFISGDYAYELGWGCLIIWDISTPTAPQHIGFCDIGGTRFVDVDVSANHAYVAASLAGLRIIDVSTPSSPHEVGFFDKSPKSLYANDICVLGNYAYVTDGLLGLFVIDISTPSSPKKVSCIELDSYGLSISGDYAYVAGREAGLYIIDISNPHSLEKVGHWSKSSVPPIEFMDVYVSGNFAYIAAAWAGLCVIDVSTPSSPREVGVLDPWEGCAYGISVCGKYVYVTEKYCNSSTPGLSVIDVSNKNLPQQVGFLNTAYWPSTVYATDNIAYVAAAEAGLYIFKNDLISDVESITDQHPEDFNILQNYPNPFNPTTSIEYELPYPAHVRITICDVRGRHIKTLVNQQQGNGHFQTTWDGMDERGTPVAGGIYFCRMQAGDYRSVVKMVLVR